MSESGGDPEPLEQLEFPIELNPDDEGLAWPAWAGGLALLAAAALVFVLAASDDTDNDVLKWCLLPDRTDRDKKLYLALLEINGELPDIITVESESEW